MGPQKGMISPSERKARDDCMWKSFHYYLPQSSESWTGGWGWITKRTSRKNVLMVCCFLLLERISQESTKVELRNVSFSRGLEEKKHTSRTNQDHG